jgi:uncharacterized protein YcbX
MTAAYARIAALHCYPVKSARGIERTEARLTSAGLEQDRRWMVITPTGRFMTQREVPTLARIRPMLDTTGLTLTAAGTSPLRIPAGAESAGSAEFLRAAGTSGASGATRSVRVWRDDCRGVDEGDEAAAWLAGVIGRECRLVRFAADQRRLSDRHWTGDVEAENRFSDGFPVLIIGAASLAELNSRLRIPLPMNRFRPNLVLEGLDAFDEDRIHELHDGEVRLRLVKPCTRCAITTTNQDTAQVEGDEPLVTLRTYRYDDGLRGVMFGQNAIIVAGAGHSLHRGQELQIGWK